MGRPSASDSLAAACWSLALGALLLIFHAGHPLQAHLVHSDALYLPVLFDDLLLRGGSMADWFLTPAPYFFPDMLLYWMAWTHDADVFRQTLAHAVLQSVLVMPMLYLIARRTLAAGAWLAAAALSILFIWLGINAGDPFVRLFSSAHHYGAFFASLLLIACWLGLDARPRKVRAMAARAAIVGVTFLSTLSDTLFLVQIVIPLAAATLLCRHVTGTPGPRHVLLLLAAGVAAMASYRLFVTHPTRYSTRLSLASLPANAEEMGRIGAALAGQHPLLAAALLLSLALGAAGAVACLCKRSLPRLSHTVQLLSVFAFLSCAVTVGAMLLAKNILPVPRYLIGALAWPLVAGLLALACLLGDRFRYAGSGLCLVFSGLLAAQAWHVRATRDAERHYYPEQIACIDRVLATSGARHGIAQYWDAKRLQALSRHRLTLAQYTDRLQPMKWITSTRFYRDGYDFAIIADAEAAQWRLPRAQLVAANGEPLQSVTCGDRTVLIYEAGRLRLPSAAPSR